MNKIFTPKEFLELLSFKQYSARTLLTNQLTETTLIESESLDELTEFEDVSKLLKNVEYSPSFRSLKRIMTYSRLVSGTVSIELPQN